MTRPRKTSRKQDQKKEDREKKTSPPDEQPEADTPDGPIEAVEETDYLDQLQRLQAEFSNFRRRIQKERLLWETRAKGDLLAGLLPILDDLSRARAAIEGKPDGRDAEGLLMILSRLESHLASIGLATQETEPGTPFDPNQHEAMMTGVSEEHEEGMILDTFQPGYLYQDLLLRPARVQVSAGPEEPAEPQPSESGDSVNSG
jgi:molecular chaperone GrpE